MTEFGDDMRDLTVEEIDDVSGGPIWVAVAVGVVAVGALGALAIGFMGAHNKAVAEEKAE